VKHTTTFGRAFRTALLSSAVVAVAMPAMAQQQSAASDTKLEEIVVTGSRIVRANEVSNSPIAVVSFEALTNNSDLTIADYLNSLPQVTPSGGSTSNNPGNNGQSNVSLRSLGAFRNLVLVDGRRPMVSTNDLRVDLNTIPQALIQSIEVITGGAGAVYGADAVSGVVNVKLKTDFEGVNVRASYSNSTEPWDSEEYQFSGLLGGNFGGDKGNAVLAFDYSDREILIKSQRAFAAIATATTSFNPEGVYFESGNAPPQSAVDAVFARYGVAAGAVPTGIGMIGFNLDGTLFSRGVFNSPINVQNFKYPIDFAVNTRLFPDVYSYNFDAVNILTLPLERTALMSKINYDLSDNVEMFANVAYTRYSSAQALAPTPVPTVTTESPTGNNPIRVKSALVEPGRTVANQLIVPVTNPFIPADFRTLLASRTGNNLNIVGSGATEPFTMRQRTLTAGLRQSNFENEVVQYLAGFRGDITDDWRYEIYASEGRTEIAQTQIGNIDAQRMQGLLEAADGGASICQGGFNPFGRQPISAACLTYLQKASTLTRDFTQRIAQGYVQGDIAELPAGTLSVVAGLEHRGFKYIFDPGAASGPISGFNAQNPEGGTNRFNDIFTEALVPLAKDADFANSLELSLGYRYSSSKFTDTVRNVEGRSKSDSTYKAELSWEPVDTLRARGSYQRAVRAPNFSELFAGGGSAPQYFDPCSVTSQFRRNGGAAAAALCTATGVGNAAVYVQTPGTQISIITDGNTNLESEKADTITLGAVATTGSDNRWLERLTGSLDYYKIKIKGAILTPEPNLIVASCYNYFGTNTSLSATDPNCRAVVRGGGDILFLSDPGNPATGNFAGINAGVINTSGLDLQMRWGFDLEWMGAPSDAGAVTFDLYLNRLLDYKQQRRASLPKIDYAGTVSYFGQGLSEGASLPTWKGVLNTNYTIGDFSFDLRTRYIDGMVNRASRQYIGETQFTGVGDVWYWDFAGTWDVTEYASLRVGVNNIADRLPPTYAPNVQSGTDPSLYDVIGRRVFFQTNIKF
jgi:outer membrane receptor protein involved in Fe transport